MPRFNKKVCKSKMGKGVKKEHHDLVMKYAIECMRELSDKKYGIGKLDIPFNVETHYRKEGYGGWGSRRRILINTFYIDEERRSCWEYPSHRDCKIIGAFVANPELVLKATVAHEIAHHIQYAYKDRFSPAMKKELRKPHGLGWKRIYGWLRSELINPEIREQKELQAA